MYGEGGTTNGAPPPSYDSVQPAQGQPAYNPAYQQGSAPAVSAPSQPVQVVQQVPAQGGVQMQAVQVVPAGGAAVVGGQQGQVVYVMQAPAGGAPVAAAPAQPVQYTQPRVDGPVASTSQGYPGTAGQSHPPATNAPMQPQGQGGTQVVVVQRQSPGYDDPCCLYVFAVFGFLFPLVGFIGMCVYGCGQNLPPRQSQAFRTLCICTLCGFILGIIISVAG